MSSGPRAGRLFELPGGRRVRGASLRQAAAAAALSDFTVYLLPRPPRRLREGDRWIRWRDFRQPTSTEDALAVLREAYERAAQERVLLVCRGGAGRTGTALAVLAMLDGLSAEAAVDRVRSRYHRRGVETSGQRRWLCRVEERR